MVWDVSWLVWLYFCVCVCARLFYFILFSHWNPVDTENSVFPHLWAPLGGFPKLLFGEKWRCLFLCTDTSGLPWPPFLLHVAKPPEAFSPDVRLSQWFPCTPELCSHCRCVLRLWKWREIEGKHPLNYFRGGVPLKRVSIRGVSLEIGLLAVLGL